VQGYQQPFVVAAEETDFAEQKVVVEHHAKQ